MPIDNFGEVIVHLGLLFDFSKFFLALSININYFMFIYFHKYLFISTFSHLEHGYICLIFSYLNFSIILHVVDFSTSTSYS